MTDDEIDHVVSTVNGCTSQRRSQRLAVPDMHLAPLEQPGGRV